MGPVQVPSRATAGLSSSEAAPPTSCLQDSLGCLKSGSIEDKLPFWLTQPLVYGAARVPLLGEPGEPAVACESSRTRRFGSARV